jgi:peptidyl-prolyl cis-trans isomerase D
MLKHMRKHAKYFYFLFAIVIVAFVFWIPGMGRNDGSQAQTLVEIGDQTISVQEYWRVYENMADLYRDVYREEFDPEAMNLKGIVLDKLIEDRLLLIAASEAGVTVTDTELQEAVVNNPTFQREGRFDSQVYENTLRLNRMSPATYEAIARQDLLRDKMRRMVQATVELSPAEVKGLSGDEEAYSSLRDTLLESKQAQALRSFLDGIKQHVPITVNEQLIS